MPYTLRTRKAVAAAEEQAIPAPKVQSNKSKVTKKTTPAKETKPTSKTTQKPSAHGKEFKALHQKVVAEIQKLGPKVKALIKHKVAQTVVGKKFETAKAVEARILKQLSVVGDAVEKKGQLNTAVLKRSVNQEIKSLGARPIALIAKRTVKKGLNLHELTNSRAVVSGVSKKKPAFKRTISKEALQKSLETELSKLGSHLYPSAFKASAAVAPVKTAVNTEVLKTAIVKEIKARGIKTSRPSSPTKAPKSPKAKSPLPKSPKRA